MPEVLDDDRRWNQLLDDRQPRPTDLPQFFGERPLRRNIKFALPSTTSHLHNAHTASESDGHPNDWINPGEYWDHHYGNFPAFYDEREKLTTLWYHDHRMDFTAANVYAGLDGFYFIFDELFDRTGQPIPEDKRQDAGDIQAALATKPGKSTPDALQILEPGEASGWNLPSGQDHDIPLILHDLVFGLANAERVGNGANNDPHQHAELVFDGFNTDGILGDRLTVNRIIQPRLAVERRKYRFRILNGGPSRFWELTLHTLENPEAVHPFVIITGDGNFQPNSVIVESLYFGVAQRADVIIDFSHPCFAGLDHVYLVNQLEQINGKGPTGQYFLRQDATAEFEAAKKAAQQAAAHGGPRFNACLYTDAQQWWLDRHGVLRFDLCPSKTAHQDAGTSHNCDRVTDAAGNVPAVNDVSKFPLVFRDLPPIDLTEAKRERLFAFDFDGGLWTINGKVYDPNRIDAGIEQGSAELWTLRNDGNSWHHPIHSHFVEHMIVEIDGKPFYQSSIQKGGPPFPSGTNSLPLVEPSKQIRDAYMSWLKARGRQTRPQTGTDAKSRTAQEDSFYIGGSLRLLGQPSRLGKGAEEVVEQDNNFTERTMFEELLDDFDQQLFKTKLRCVTMKEGETSAAIKQILFGNMQPKIKDMRRLLLDDSDGVLRRVRFTSVQQFEWLAIFFEFLRSIPIAVPSLYKKRFMGGPRRDVALLLPGSEVKVFMRWGDFLGKHVMHCHNVVHEDHAMMIRWDIMPPGEGFDGSRGVDEVYGPTRRTPHVTPFPQHATPHVDDRDGRTER